MTRFAVRPVPVEGEHTAYFVRLRSTSARGLGRFTTYSLVSATDVHRPTTWAKAETAQKWAKKFSTTTLNEVIEFEVVEYQEPKYRVGEGVSDEEREAYLSWCSERGLRPTVAAETEYVNERILKSQEN